MHVSMRPLPENRPAYATVKPPSPKNNPNPRAQMTDRGRSNRASWYSVRDIDAVRSVPCDRVGDMPGNYLIGDIIDEDVLWACTTCGSCRMPGFRGYPEDQ
jgi:Fe-S oxidoreductase